MSLAATLGTGGALAAGVYYYAVSACDAAGAESALSFSVLAVVVEDGGSVTLTGLSFTAAASTFNVYRGVRRRSSCGSHPTSRWRRSSQIRG